MRNNVLLLVLSFTLFAGFTPGNKKVILVVFAHPDDELAIAPALAKLSAEYMIYIVYATDGKDGTRVNNIPPDSLGKIRMAEVTCSLQQLGAQPPIFLHVDCLDSRHGLSPFWKQTKIAKDSLKNIILRLNPNALITIGPDGDTGHPEHRVISALTTELILREGWVDRFPLYYFMWTKKQADIYEQLGIDQLMYTDEQYANLQVQYTYADKEKGWQAMKCHKSQYTPKELEETILSDKKDSSNISWFRKFAVDKKRRTSF
ncbi:MAG: PIG-L family deacetylase [Chitinophagaceae bacterium]